MVEVSVDFMVVLFIMVSFFLGCSLKGLLMFVICNVFMVDIVLLFLVIVLELGLVVRRFVIYCIFM